MNVSLLNKLIIPFIFIFIFIFISLSFFFSFYLFNDAWIEWKLSEKLIQEGIPTQAVVQSCTRRRGNCNTTYQYEVPSSDEQIKTVTVREYGCNCRKGEQITVFYLPDNPSQARFYTNKYILSLNLAIILFGFSIGWIAVLTFFLIKSIGIFNENIKARKKRAAIELLLFILIFTLPGFIFGLFLDLVIFKVVVKLDKFIEMAEIIIKSGIYAIFLCIPYSFFKNLKKINYLYLSFLFYLVANFLLGGIFWFIIQPLITLGARLAWILHNQRIYVWSLFWGLITIWVVLSWITWSIEDDVKASESHDLAK